MESYDILAIVGVLLGVGTVCTGYKKKKDKDDLKMVSEEINRSLKKQTTDQFFSTVCEATELSGSNKPIIPKSVVAERCNDDPKFEKTFERVMKTKDGIKNGVRILESNLSDKSYTMKHSVEIATDPVFSAQSAVRHDLLVVATTADKRASAEGIRKCSKREKKRVEERVAALKYIASSCRQAYEATADHELDTAAYEAFFENDYAEIFGLVSKLAVTKGSKKPGRHMLRHLTAAEESYKRLCCKTMEAIKPIQNAEHFAYKLSEQESKLKASKMRMPAPNQRYCPRKG